MGDAPRLLARLQAQQGRPEAATFRQLHSGIAQLLALRRLVATLAPGAAAAAAAAASQADDNSDGEATGIGSKHSLGSGLFVGGWADGSADWLGDRPTAWGSARAGLLGADGGQARDGRGRGGRPRSGHATAWDRLPIAKKVLESITSELEACECRLSAPPPQPSHCLHAATLRHGMDGRQDWCLTPADTPARFWTLHLMPCTQPQCPRTPNLVLPAPPPSHLEAWACCATS